MAQYHRNKKSGATRGRKPRTKTPPVPAKSCVVQYLPANALMNYRPETKQLFLDGSGSYHVFPSRSQARKAIWHTAQKEPGSHADYRIEEV